MDTIRIRVRPQRWPEPYRVDELPGGPEARTCDLPVVTADVLHLQWGRCYEVTVREITEAEAAAPDLTDSETAQIRTNEAATAAHLAERN